MNVNPPPSLWECGNPAPFAGFPSAVETVEKSLLLLDFSTVSMARHFHNESLVLCSSAPSPFFRPQIPPKTLKYMMAETSYYRPQVITCREWAQQGKFGTIFYTEAEYHHEGLAPLWYDARGFPTWRYGFAPMHYPTHCTGIVVPITGERLVEVQAVGWGDGHEVLSTNEYKNPFWNTTGLFKTSAGHASRISVFWHVAAGGTERGSVYGSLMSYIFERPEGSPDTAISISKDGKTVIDANGYPEGDVKIQPYKEPEHWNVLPPSLRVPTGHGGSHTFLTHEFISAIVEDRWPTVNVYEAIAFTLPGIIAHQSALRGGEPMKIQDYGRAPA
jgi:predicted dehydrogenase